MNEIKVVVKMPEQMPVVKMIPNTLEAMQEVVEGMIEVVHVAHHKGEQLIALVNENAKLLEKSDTMKYNCHVNGVLLVGPIIFLGQDLEDFKSVPETALEPLVDLLESMEVKSSIESLLSMISSMPNPKCEECSKKESCRKFKDQ